MGLGVSCLSSSFDILRIKRDCKSNFFVSAILRPVSWKTPYECKNPETVYSISILPSFLPLNS